MGRLVIADLTIADSARARLRQLRDAGFEVEAAGGYLRIRPADRVTPALRAELEQHKPALLVLLEPVNNVVTLCGGLIVAAPALALAIDLEARGFKQSIDTGGNYCIEPHDRLTDVHRAAVTRWRRHLAAIVGYTPPVCA
jgi:hypothetical protein